MSSTSQMLELDLLRGRVADLSRQLAERDRSAEDLQKQSDVLRAIVKGTATETGEKFFAALVTHLTSVLKVQYAVIGEVQGDRIKKIRTLAVSAGDTLVDNFEYELAHTPCAIALTQTFACFHWDVQATFPQFQRLADLGVESYCAVPLQTKGGAVIGLIVVMDTKPLQNGDYLQSLLGVFAPRVVVELERKRADQERAQALADIHNVMETLPGVMFTLDTQSNLVKWNRRLGDVTGYSPEELLNKPALVFVPAEERARTAAAIQGAFTEGYAEFDGHLLAKDLRTIPYHWTAVRLKNPHGEPIGITGVGRDVSDKKRMEGELTRQQRHLLDAQALAHLGSWDWDVNTGEVQWSDEQFRISGHEPGSISVTYDTFLASLHPADQATVIAAVNNALLGKCIYNVEYRIVRPNGEVRFIHARGDVHRDVMGLPLRMAGTVLDITERYLAEMALRNQEQLLRTVTETATDAIFMKDAEGRYVLINSAGADVIGKPVDQIVGRDDRELFPPEVATLLMANDRQVISGFEQARFEAVIPLKGGSRVFYSVKTPYRDRQGKVIGLVGVSRDVTELKQAEERLRQSEERYRMLYDGTPTMYFTLATDGTVRSVNRFGAEQLGYQVEELVGHSVLGIFYEEDKETVAASLSECLATPETTRHWEFRKVRKDGTIIWVRETARVSQSSTGETVVLVTCEDITERRRIEEALRKSEHYNRILFENSPIGLVLCQLDGTIADCNERYVDILGRDRSDILGKTYWELTSKKYDEQALSVMETVCRTGRFGPFEKEYVHADGHLVPVRLFGSLIEKEGVLFMVCSVEDITERMRAEKALRASEERFNLAVRGSNTGIWDWDLRSNKVYFSPLWKSMLGYEEHELLGEISEWEERLHPDDRERSLATVRAYLDRTTPQYELEYRLCHKDGSYRWILARGVSLLDAEGNPYRMAGSHIDITEQKQIQEALAQHERQLRTVLEALPVGVWFTDRSGKPLLVNPVAKQIWSGVKQVGIETTANAAGWWEVTGPSNELHRWALSHTLTTGVPSLNETLEFECLDGTKKTIRNSTVPVRDEAGGVLGAIVLNEDITILRLAQEALQLTQFSVDCAVEGFFWIGPDARILNVNDAACRMLEYTRDELTAMTVHDIDPNFPQEVWPAHWEELKQKGALTFESKHWSRSGRVLDMEVTVNYLQYEGKEYNCAIMRDITERKRAEEALCVSEERYRFLVDNAPIGIFLNEAGRFTYANLALQRILNATKAEQLLGTPVLDRIAPEYHTVEKDRIHQLIEKGQSAPSLDEQYVRLDGSRVDVAVTAIPASFGGLPVMQVLVLDITKRKQAEEALAQLNATLEQQVHHRAEALRVSEERLKLAVEVADLGIFEQDHFADRSDFSPRLPAMFGWNPESPISLQEIIARVFPLDREGLAAAIGLAQDPAGDGSLAHEHRVVWPDGSIHWLSIRSQTWFVGEGSARRPSRTVGAVCDITERKRAEETLAKLNVTLEQEVADRTRELLQSEQAIRALHEATAASGLSFDERLRAVLEVGCRRFDLPIGMRTQVVGEKLEYVQVWAPSTDFTAGMAVPLGNTYCNTTLQADNPVCCEHAGASVWENHPGYKTLGLECYLGTKLIGRDRVYGTVCFAGQAPRLASFSQADKDFIQLMARWISGELDRRMAEQALKQSEERYHALYDDTPTMYFTLAHDGTVLSVNRFGAEQLGYRVEELVGHSVLDVFYDEDKETVAASLSECLATPEITRHWEFRKVRKDGTIIWVQETVHVGTSSSGETIVLVTCEDITDRKRMEEMLRQRERDLQAALQERERISQELHDGILQSLFAVGLTLETTKSMLPPRNRKISGAPLDQAIKQLNLVMQEIRNFIAGLGSDLLQGKDMPTVLQHMLASLTQNQATRVRLSVEDRAVRAVSAEQSLHLLRVIQEAVSNCIRHGCAQEARVSLKMLKQGVRLSIRDNGRGFDLEAAQGTGHGLGNMAARAQKIGGRFTVSSKMNEGTRIVLDLPKEVSYVPC